MGRPSHYIYKNVSEGRTVTIYVKTVKFWKNIKLHKLALFIVVWPFSHMEHLPNFSLILNESAV